MNARAGQPEQAVVIKPYERPYANTIAAGAGETVVPDFDRHTDIAGWVWCRARDGRAGWTPRAWLSRKGEEWRLDRNFDAIELTVHPGETLEVQFEESGFAWASKSNGEKGWVPIECLELAK
ncbi:MAG TPA: SH3 domain-containing protein [Gammaproteobacteria bacterium]|nr:SH3 domain-containing protein [Gammaproteobacteria bacterium]